MAPGGAARPRLLECFGWTAVAIVGGAVVGWLAHLVQGRFAPLVVFPLLTGAVLGIVLALAMRAFGWGHRATSWYGVALAALVAVVLQHALGYRDAVRRAETDIEKYQQALQAFPEQLAGRLPRPPEGPIEYFRRQAERGRPVGGYRLRGAAVYASWMVDAALLWLAATAVVVAARRHPYCTGCRSWYTGIRASRLDPDEAAAVAEAAGFGPIGQPQRASYRLLACRGGCGPLGLELSYVDSGRRWRSQASWLDAADRERLLVCLDGISAARRPTSEDSGHQ